MARSFSNAKFISTFVADRFSVIASRRGYAAASQGAESSSVGGVVRSKLILKRGGEISKETMTAWVPDPVTGYYRPEGKIKEMDAADLRNMLLKNKN